MGKKEHREKREGRDRREIGKREERWRDRGNIRDVDDLGE